MKKFNLLKKYKEGFLYIKHIRKYIYFVIVLFFLFSFIGFFIPAPESLYKEILKYLEELIEKTKNFGFGEMLGFIFFNNLKSSFFGFILGGFLGIFPILASASNGYVLGFVSFKVVSQEGISVLWRLIPHGVFELPAIFISLGMGVNIGAQLFKKKFSLKAFLEELKKSSKVFIFIIIPLLLIAAFIEAFFILFV